MTPRYRLTPTAQANVDDICAFIANDSVDAALKVLDALEHAFDELAAMPGIGHTRDDLTNRPVKFWSVLRCPRRRADSEAPRLITNAMIRLPPKDGQPRPAADVGTEL